MRKLKKIMKKKKPEPIRQAPLQMVKEVEENPTPSGVLGTTVWGIPVDLHSLEGFIPKISPHVLKTIVRNDRARTIEQIKNYSVKKKMHISAGIFALMIVIVAIAIIGLLILTQGDKITAFFQGMAP